MESFVMFSLILSWELLQSVLVAMGSLSQSTFAIQYVTIFQKFIKQYKPEEKDKIKII